MMQTDGFPSRRRAIAITAGMIGAASFGMPGSAASRETVQEYGWQGIALGAEASIRLYHDEEGAARDLIRRCRDEIARLERIFSLYDRDSELSRLNRAGELDLPSQEMVQLLDTALNVALLSGGRFDPTIQPVFDLYARHFADMPEDTAGPNIDALRAAAAQVDYRAVEVTSARIALNAPSRAVTLNGIAQGFITDRISQILRRAGMRHVLVNLGEYRGLGPRADGTAWSVSLAPPAFGAIPVTDGALATSGGYGTRFETSGRHHHLLDPNSGESAHLWQSVTVTAPDATLADGLSTAASLMPLDDIRKLIARFDGVKGYLFRDGTRVVV